MYKESEKKSPDYEEPLWDIFDVSPVLDSKIRKLNFKVSVLRSSHSKSNADALVN